MLLFFAHFKMLYPKGIMRLFGHMTAVIASIHSWKAYREEVCHVVAEGAVVGMLLHCHQLDCVVAQAADPRQHVLCKLHVRVDLHKEAKPLSPLKKEMPVFMLVQAQSQEHKTQLSDSRVHLGLLGGHAHVGLVDAQVLWALGARVLEGVGCLKGGHLPRGACLRGLIVHSIELNLVPLLRKQLQEVSAQDT